MKYELRDYQILAKKQTYSEIRSGKKRVINWINMGGGKGLLMPEYAADAISKNKKVLVVMRRRDLIFQTRENFKKYRGIKTSIIMGQEKGFDNKNPVQICSIDTLRTRIKKPEYAFLKDFDMIEIDECHDTTSPSYQKLFDFLGDKIYIGFTATPYATGNRPLRFWQSAIQPIKPSELRDRGYLIKDRFFRPGKIDTTGIRKANGEFKIDELFEVVTDLKIIGDAIDSYKKYGDSGSFIGFCVNKAHSKLMAKAFSDVGIKSIHIDESHTAKEREAAKIALEDGSIKGVFNVNIFSTGWDCPSISTLIGLRPTMSEILALQQWGRVLRTSPGTGKIHAIILDHADNCSRFGFPYDDGRSAVLSDFALEHKKKEERKEITKVKDCPECLATIESGRKECPFCEHIFAAEVRKLKEEEGELVEVSQGQEIDKVYPRVKKMFDNLCDKEKSGGWKPTAKYFKLIEHYGESVFKYEKELMIPSWIKKSMEKNSSEKLCKNCKYFKKGGIYAFNKSKYLGVKSSLKIYDLGHCGSFGGATVKKNWFCIKFSKKA